jgi:hypothetical protein
MVCRPLKHPIRKPAPPGQGVPVFTIGDQPIARRGLKLFMLRRGLASIVVMTTARDNVQVGIISGIDQAVYLINAP